MPPMTARSTAAWIACMHIADSALDGWRDASSAALDLLFPRRCGACGGDLGERAATRHALRRVRRALGLIDWPVCPRCAAPVPSTDGVDARLQSLPRRQAAVRSHARAGQLRGSAAATGDADEGRPHGRRDARAGRTGVAAARRPSCSNCSIDVVTAVPMHPWRRWQRGVNPPRDMAERLAGKLGVPAAPAACCGLCATSRRR